MTNVLFVGAGKRVTMGNFFSDLGALISSYELDTNSPINLVCEDVLEGYRWSDKEVYAHLTKTIKQGGYELIIPFQCAAVEILSRIRENENIESICVSDVSTSNICLQKNKFEEFFIKNENLRGMYPRPITAPVVLKPIRGNASRGIEFHKTIPDIIPDGYIMQKEIVGTEYSVDCYFGVNGELIDYVPRIREEVTSGEVTKSVTTTKDIFEKENTIQRISQEFNFRGPICMQFIVDRDNRPWIIEINCRFGGGATLSIFSGLKIPEYMIGEYVRGENLANYNSEWREGVRVVRCFQDYYYEENSI